MRSKYPNVRVALVGEDENAFAIVERPQDGLQQVVIVARASLYRERFDLGGRNSSLAQSPLHARPRTAKQTARDMERDKRLAKLDALANDRRGNENERGIAKAMAAKLRANRGRR